MLFAIFLRKHCVYSLIICVNNFVHLFREFIPIYSEKRCDKSKISTDDYSTVPFTRFSRLGLVVLLDRDTRRVPAKNNASCIPPVWHVCKNTYTKHEDEAVTCRVIYKRRGEKGRDLSGKKTKNRCKYLHRLFEETMERIGWAHLLGYDVIIGVITDDHDKSERQSPPEEFLIV